MICVHTNGQHLKFFRDWQDFETYLDDLQLNGGVKVQRFVDEQGPRAESIILEYSAELFGRKHFSTLYATEVEMFSDV